MKELRFRFRLRTLFVAISLLAICLAWLVNWWQSRPSFQILTLGGSQAMEPFINGRTYLAVDMNAYRTANPKRWEAVVFRLQQPSQAGRAPTACILRVIGLPGETVSFSAGKVFIDGKPLESPRYLPSHLQNVSYESHLSDVEVITTPYTVPDGCYYLLGDNPAVASDSRMFGALPQAEILSRYPTQISEPNPWPQLYVMILLLVASCWLFLSWRKRQS